MTSPNSGEKELTHKQRVFCEQYVISHNATQAAIAAGYQASNARKVGSENLTKLDIKKYIKKLEKAALEKATQTTLWEALLEIGNCVGALPKVRFGHVEDSGGQFGYLYGVEFHFITESVGTVDELDEGENVLTAGTSLDKEQYNSNITMVAENVIEE